jgi:hypothetical protein
METTDIEDTVQTTTGHVFRDGTVIELMRRANHKGAVLRARRNAADALLACARTTLSHDIRHKYKLHATSF